MHTFDPLCLLAPSNSKCWNLFDLNINSHGLHPLVSSVYLRGYLIMWFEIYLNTFNSLNITWFNAWYHCESLKIAIANHVSRFAIIDWLNEEDFTWISLAKYISKLGPKSFLSVLLIDTFPYHDISIFPIHIVANDESEVA
jgi:hypothetical protein